MTDSPTADEIRQMVREEIARANATPTCPECGMEMGYTMGRIREMVNDEEEWTIGCIACDHHDEPSAFDPVGGSA